MILAVFFHFGSFGARGAVQFQNFYPHTSNLDILLMKGYAITFPQSKQQIWSSYRAGPQKVVVE